MEYEVWIPADGKGDHPSFMILTLAKDALAEIGMTLTIKDLTNSADLWTALEAQQVAMWAAAWGATVDPDMYQIYYSDVGRRRAPPPTARTPWAATRRAAPTTCTASPIPELDQLIMVPAPPPTRPTGAGHVQGLPRYRHRLGRGDPCLSAPERHHLLL